jgi:hypothetical protein
MEYATAVLLINGLTSLMTAMPQIIASIKAMNVPEEDKQALLDRIKAAQASLPEWV